MVEIGAILIDGDSKIPKNDTKIVSKDREKEKNKERERRRKARLEEEMQKYCDLKKKIKMDRPQT